MRNNLTFLRILCAALVIVGHSAHLVGTPELTPKFLQWTAVSSVAVYVFFAISGYLIAKSWSHDPRFMAFFIKRALRIFPGLLVCVILSIIFLALLTQNSWVEYFSSPITYGYLKNIVLYINYNLPGVFTDNPYPNAVNGSLWTLPFEFLMYLILPFLLYFKNFRSISLILTTILFCYLSINFKSDMILYNSPIKYLFILGGYFLSGTMIFHFRLDRFFNVSNFSMVSIFWLLSSYSSSLFSIASYFALPFLTLCFGMSYSVILKWFDKHDVSYGIYIYGFVVQQTIVHLWPQISFMHLVLSSLACTVFFAYFSWIWVERPALSLKHKWSVHKI